MVFELRKISKRMQIMFRNQRQQSQFGQCFEIAPSTRLDLPFPPFPIRREYRLFVFWHVTVEKETVFLY